jgi:hypothetical protein
MQARLETRQIPTRSVAVALAMTAAVAASAVVGYTLKATTVITGPTRVIHVSSQPAPAQNDCVRIGTLKAC